MKNNDFHDTYDVVVVGLGPVGATLANLLGMLGIKVLVLDREAEAYHLPRAVHFDDEVMRVFQWIGIADELLPEIRINPGMRFQSPDGTLLLDWPRPLEEGPHAWHPSWRFHQPDLERILRSKLTTYDSVTVRCRAEAFMVEDKGDGVEVRFEDMAMGEIHRVTAQYAVGCDGARSLVRRFIESRMKDFGFHERWLVVDVLLNQDKPELGDHSIQFCDPNRPATYVRGPKNRRRWEITVLPEESNTAVTKDSFVWQLLSPWLTPDEATLERSAVYTFHSLSAEVWQKGRLLVAGDAAHQTPPFMGQGMCAGIRDAANLAWKLAESVEQGDGDTLLESYQSERQPNAEAYISKAIALGRLINTVDSEPALRAAMSGEDGNKKMQSLYPILGPGLGTGANAGKQFGQPRMLDGSRMDEHIGYRYVYVTTDDIAVDLRSLTSLPVISVSETQNGADYLMQLETKGVLLRPDRYILGCGETVNALAELVNTLPQHYQQKKRKGMMI
ncbi:bifunctional 3-(3-hydroxy-phenyl)propionate/3-hydroxycinnamic acid hydroxylase [Veronia pacifica]|uniref:3-(3-hydroxyphenyl)propionate hydroxylase n=1 Tax=Veronia pacifica TaxID=1080227 RepID=A0A1C3EEU9_9GAMM|nr:bifunctional 3-(3-hydroxy-phenyl)propionate/3-hydroxycinnamic acid hydroxylase [Veronia pacifica]ODA31766.1 3-(3-hydroxyphenyl)propionate hydroxylase [Veronia pacifica]